MPRKNHRPGRRPQARRERPQIQRSAPPPPQLDALVIPKGRCFHNSRRGKLRFAAEDAPKALEQAQRRRQRVGSAYVETRTYVCPSCGDHHLTSREEYRS